MHDETESIDPIDPIEEALRGLAPRAVPPSWRREILAACAAAAPSRPRRPVLIRLLLWLWPGPGPTAALAGLWLLILAFFVNTPPAPPTVDLHIDPAVARAAYEERQHLLALLAAMEAERQTPPRPPGATFSFPLHRPGG